MRKKWNCKSITNLNHLKYNIKTCNKSVFKKHGWIFNLLHIQKKKKLIIQIKKNNLLDTVGVIISHLPPEILGS